MVNQYKNNQSLYNKVLVNKSQNPCSESLVSSLLKDMHFKLDMSLPEDYLNLLRHTDGYNDGQLEIYASNTIFCKKQRRLIHGLLSMNEYFQNYFSELVIGEWKNELIAYNYESNRYLLMRTDGVRDSHFSSLLELLVMIVDGDLNAKNIKRESLK